MNPRHHDLGELVLPQDNSLTLEWIVFSHECVSEQLGTDEHQRTMILVPPQCHDKSCRFAIESVVPSTELFRSIGGWVQMSI